ncbi:hypothetical protein GCM10008955_17470 [Deinococcus malanensis]|uniref:Ribbon-helix-helix protein CopG domain-containing protein n=1 Tax=Deinococcus malanensis TaxID=1706855 RepID=A0ABQ2ET12_9DEIO|nr:hypothetical protein [Deinococcus malanensis]GGK24391.1 hypothetical protein GCM10008955_17470 [Deinococcus malanensis]
MTQVTVTLNSQLLTTLEQIAQAHNCSLEEVVMAALQAYVLPSGTTLDLAQLGEAMLRALEETATDQGPDEHITVEQAEAMMALITLGHDLWTSLVGVPPGSVLTEKASARQAAVTSIVQLLRATLTEKGVMRWWTRPRSHLSGSTPLGLLPPDWTPDSAAFRKVQTLAEADCGFAAT